MSCTCHGCNCQYTVDIIVPNEVWTAIYTENTEKAIVGGGLLCPGCILKRLEGLGYSAFHLAQYK